ncbi:hypothetical protein, partial [Rosistilla oblonga]|uniref:hypothetical protein n=1 Tax=Rosistilla oblonga TaxID=2527990 RepID=UPI003A9854FA
MAWRPSDWVLEGELDNRTLDWTVGWIRLRDREEPLQLKLLGNCHPDLAGWKFQIVRTDPIPDWVGEPNYDGIATDQSGTIGDVTADQVLRHYECSSKEFVRRSYAGETPNATYFPVSRVAERDLCVWICEVISGIWWTFAG